jgi:hypothetical protein
MKKKADKHMDVKEDKKLISKMIKAERKKDIKEDKKMMKKVMKKK